MNSSSEDSHLQTLLLALHLDLLRLHPALQFPEANEGHRQEQRLVGVVRSRLVPHERVKSGGRAFQVLGELGGRWGEVGCDPLHAQL